MEGAGDDSRLTSHETHDSLASRRLDAHNYFWRDYQTENLLGFGTVTHTVNLGAPASGREQQQQEERVMRKELQGRTEGDGAATLCEEGWDKSGRAGARNE